MSDKFAYMREVGGRVGIERFGAFIRTDGDDEGPSEKEIVRALEAHHPYVLGFVWVSLPKVQESIDKLNRWVRDGPFVGLKLGGGSGICSKPEYDPVFERAVALDTIIYIHTWLKVGGDPRYPGGGNLEAEPTPEDVVAVAQRYPDHEFICGHHGGDWALGTRMVRDQPNVPVEISGSYPMRGQVDMAVRELGADRIVYGTDIPGRSFGSQLGKVWGANITDKDRAKIFSGNLRRIGRNILKRKGYI